MNQKVERVRTSLQIQEDIDLHIKGWIFQRMGWALLLIILVCSLLGLFGNGILSEEIIVKDESSIMFERYARRDNDAEMKIWTPQSSGTIKVSLSPVFTKNFKVENMSPEPREQMIKNGFATYEFAAQEQAEITFFLTARQAGNVQSTVIVNDTEFQLKQFIYP